MAKSPEYHDIAELFDLESLLPPVFKPRENLGKPLLLKEMQFRHGQQGDYYLLTCVDLESGEDKLFSTGAVQPCKVCSSIQPNMLPFAFKFMKSGNSYVMASLNAKA